MKTTEQLAAKAAKEIRVRFSGEYIIPSKEKSITAIIKAAIEEARDEGYEECRRLWVRAEADWKSRTAQARSEIELEVAGYKEMADSQFNTAEKLRAEIKQFHAAQAQRCETAPPLASEEQDGYREFGFKHEAL